eukprot:CAMPEP_0117774166 /NCGR_PEP_ID=MMETSP0947-20121206/26329_1 /TAXON_ID=44440 /ORGANISM="Chattonella subsalsa, Strain CCMP2191" /LENGTH=33 /DNA_ID= /DNA_START= /DNA_END= /DNA_ORIENTATION=
MMESSDKIASINIDPSPERQMKVGKDADESWEK